MDIKIDQEFLVKTITDLVQINSMNPTLVAGAPGEVEIAGYVANTLKNIGLNVEKLEPEPGRVSVVGILKGSGGGRSLMLNGHIDTVDVEGMPNPFSAEIRDGKLYGRGAYDMKASVAAQIAAAKALVDGGIQLSGDLLIAAVADEEHSSIGTADLIRHYKTDAAIVTEPTEMEICLAHKGFIWLEIEILGRAAHGSRYDLGIDANMHAGKLLAELETLLQEIYQRQKHPLLGPGSFHISTINGGTGLSTYSERCTIQIERRTLPGESETQVISEYQTILDKLSQADSNFNASLKTILVRPPFEVAPDAEIVKSINRSALAVLDSQPPMVGQNPWMDSAFLAEAGIETVVMGPSGAGAHAAEEWIEIQSVIDFTEILAKTAIDYCQ